MDTTETLAAGLGGLPSKLQSSWVIKSSKEVAQKNVRRSSRHVDSWEPYLYISIVEFVG